MATASATRSGRPTAAARRAAKVRRRRRNLVLGLITVLGVVLLIGLHPLKHAVQEITLPLRHEDIIRQQSHKKGLAPLRHRPRPARVRPRPRQARASAAPARGAMLVPRRRRRWLPAVPRLPLS